MKVVIFSCFAAVFLAHSPVGAQTALHFPLQVVTVNSVTLQDAGVSMPQDDSASPMSWESIVRRLYDAFGKPPRSADLDEKIEWNVWYYIVSLVLFGMVASLKELRIRLLNAWFRFRDTHLTGKNK